MDNLQFDWTSSWSHEFPRRPSNDHEVLLLSNPRWSDLWMDRGSDWHPFNPDHPLWSLHKSWAWNASAECRIPRHQSRDWRRWYHHSSYYSLVYNSYCYHVSTGELYNHSFYFANYIQDRKKHSFR